MNKVQLLFFENKKWYRIFAYLIQKLAKKQYPKSKILPSHVAIIYDNKIYESRIAKNFIIKDFNEKEYIKKHKYDTIYSCEIEIDGFSFETVDKFKNYGYSIIKAIASYNFYNSYSGKIAKYLNLFLDKIRKLINKENNYHFCSYSALSIFLNSFNKEKQEQILQIYKKYIMKKKNNQVLLNRIKNNSLTINYLAKESTPIDVLYFIKNVFKINVKKLIIKK